MSDPIAELQAQLATATERCQRVDLLNALARELRHRDLPRALTFSEQARALASTATPDQPPYLRGLAHSLLGLGSAQADQGRSAEALAHLLEALPLFETLDDSAGRMRALHILGNLYLYLADYATALRHYLRALDLAQQLGDREQEGGELHNIGLLYAQLEDYDQAAGYLQRALNLFRELGEQVGEAACLSNLADIYRRQGQGALALEHSLRSVQLTRATGARMHEADALATLGDVYLHLGETAQALDCYRQAAAAARAVGSRYDLVEALRRLGEGYCRQSAATEAVPILREALALAEAMNAQSLLYECHRALAEADKQCGDYRQALAHHEQFHALREAVLGERIRSQIQAQEVSLRLEQARREAELREQHNQELQREVEERRKAQTALEELAVTDPLTSLYNRRHLYTLGQAELQRAQRYGHPLAAIMLDFDHFKQVNDTFGHAVGDQVLSSTARLVRQALRTVDVVARYGGEELAILLPETDLTTAVAVAERLRCELASQPIATSHGPVPITASLGVAEYAGQSAPDLDALLDRADRALYLAKQQGRNRVVCLS